MLLCSSDLSERHSREYPSGSSHGDHDQVEICLYVLMNESFWDMFSL